MEENNWKNRPNIINYEWNFIKYFQDLDEWYRNFGRPKHYKIHDRKQLILRTISGKAKIKITRYYFFENGKRRIKTIEEQHKEIKNSYHILQLLKNKINSNESYLDIAKSINFAYSPTWIYSKITSYNEEISYKNNSKFNLKSNKIYLEIDDCFQKIKDTNGQISMYRNRLLVLHQGKENNKILNKTIILETKKTNIKGLNIEQLSKKILSIINQNYGLKSPEIILISDGARWMKRLAKFLKSTHILDFWHVSNRLIKAIGYGWYKTKNSQIFQFFEQKVGENFYQFIKKLVKNGIISQAIKWLIFIKNKVKNLISKTKFNEINSLIKYLNYNQKLIQNYQNDLNLGSRTEAFISHFIKKKTTKKFAIYGIERFKSFILSQQNSNQKVVLI